MSEAGKAFNIDTALSLKEPCDTIAFFPICYPQYLDSSSCIRHTSLCMYVSRDYTTDWRQIFGETNIYPYPILPFQDARKLISSEAIPQAYSCRTAECHTETAIPNVRELRSNAVYTNVNTHHPTQASYPSTIGVGRCLKTITASA